MAGPFITDDKTLAMCLLLGGRRILENIMSRVTGATSQQSTPVSSSVAMTEEPALQTETKNESQEVESHVIAQKQNAVARQHENNLTAMLQKEQFKTIPRAHAFHSAFLLCKFVRKQMLVFTTLSKDCPKPQL